MVRQLLIAGAIAVGDCGSAGGTCRAVDDHAVTRADDGCRCLLPELRGGVR